MFADAAVAATTTPATSAEAAPAAAMARSRVTCFTMKDLSSEDEVVDKLALLSRKVLGPRNIHG
jgi:hypothetical protein